MAALPEVSILPIPSRRGVLHLASELRLSVLGPFLFKMKIAFIGGAVVSLPLWLVLISRFVGVALPPHKRVFFYVLVAASFALGVAAMALAYFYLVPISIKVFASFAVPGTTLMLTAETYLSFFLLQLLVSFIVLEIPVVVVGLSYVRLLNPHKLIGKSRIIFTVLLIGLAIITPTTDVFTLLLVTLPAFVLCIGALAIARVAYNRGISSY